MVFIIAEAGVNHNGSIQLAKQLIDKAIEAGADAVKFQTFKTELGIAKHAKMASYQISNMGGYDSQFDMVKKLELPFEAFKELKDYCGNKIMFLSTPFDLESIDYLFNLGLEVFKIPSGEIINVPYLRKVGKFNRKIILSTGMSTLGEIEYAIKVLTTSGTNKDRITILHCNTEYPTPMQDVNLKAMQTIYQAFQMSVGYSDHTLGIEVPIAAVAMGATVIEKHFTLDNNMEGPDHKASLTPHELKAMVVAIRNIELALGDGIKQLSISESKNLKVVRKSIVAKTRIKSGEIYNEQNVTLKRPGYGLSPLLWDQIIGKVAPRDFDEDELIV